MLSSYILLQTNKGNKKHLFRPFRIFVIFHTKSVITIIISLLIKLGYKAGKREFKYKYLIEQETYSCLVYICYYFYEILILNISFQTDSLLYHYFYYYFNLLMVIITFRVKYIMTMTISSLMEYEYDAKNHEFKNKHFMQQETNRQWLSCFAKC